MPLSLPDDVTGFAAMLRAAVLASLRDAAALAASCWHWCVVPERAPRDAADLLDGPLPPAPRGIAP